MDFIFGGGGFTADFEGADVSIGVGSAFLDLDNVSRAGLYTS